MNKIILEKLFRKNSFSNLGTRTLFVMESVEHG